MVKEIAPWGALRHPHLLEKRVAGAHVSIALRAATVVCKRSSGSAIRNVTGRELAQPSLYWVEVRP